MTWLGKITTIMEAFQLYIPGSLESAPLARHYFIDIKDSGLCKHHTCGTAVPRGIIQSASKCDPTDIKSFHFPSRLSAAGPSPLPGRLAAVWGTSHFLSSPDPSGPHSTFLFRPSARWWGRENGHRRHHRPSRQFAAWWRSLFSRPQPRSARAAAGEAGFYFRLNIAGEG